MCFFFTHIELQPTWSDWQGNPPNPSVHTWIVQSSRVPLTFRTFCPHVMQIFSTLKEQSLLPTPAPHPDPHLPLSPPPPKQPPEPLIENQLLWNKIGDWSGGKAAMERKAGGEKGRDEREWHWQIERQTKGNREIWNERQKEKDGHRKRSNLFFWDSFLTPLCLYRLNCYRQVNL